MKDPIVISWPHFILTLVVGISLGWGIQTEYRVRTNTYVPVPSPFKVAQ